MIDQQVIYDACMDGLMIGFDFVKPYLMPMLMTAVGIFIIKYIASKVIDFLMFESSASEIRRTKRTAFSFIDLVSSISDLFPSKRDK